MKNKTANIHLFSPHIFWDVSIQDIEIEQHGVFILERVMRYGKLKDWLLLKKTYSMALIEKYALSARDLDDFSIAFLSLILNVKKEKFRCYKLKQSQPSFWNY